MKKIAIGFFAALFLISCSSFAQLKLNVRVSANNQLRYGNGQEIITTYENNKSYFESLEM